MQKTKLLLSLLSLSTVAGVIDVPGPAPEMPTVNSDVVLSGFTNQDVYLPLTYSSAIYFNYKLDIQFVDIVTNEIVYLNTVKRKDLGLVDDNPTYNLYLPFEQYLTSNGLNIVMSHLIKKDEELVSSAVVYPFKEESINVSMYRKEPYIRNGVYLSMDDGILHSSEEYDFTDLNEFIPVEKNSKIDLTHLKFKYNCPHELTSGDIYLKIKDYNNLFPYLNKFNGEVSLKMKFEQNNSEITLKLDEPLYVNSETCEMSSSLLDGFTETDTLFVPHGKEELLLDDEVYITIKDAGFSLTDFTIPFSFYFPNKYLGECYESDYCITGGVKQWYIS